MDYYVDQILLVRYSVSMGLERGYGPWAAQLVRVVNICADNHLECVLLESSPEVQCSIDLLNMRMTIEGREITCKVHELEEYSRDITENVDSESAGEFDGLFESP